MRRIDIECRHLGLGDLNAHCVGIFIQSAGDRETFLGGRVADQLDNSLAAGQRLCAPVLGDEGEQAVCCRVARGNFTPRALLEP
jgi:hypothetical protein